MSETQRMLRETVSRLFERLFDPARLRRIADEGLFPHDEWTAVAQLGLPLAAVREEVGGSGLGLADALSIVPLIGEHAAPLPLAETMAANWLLSQHGLAPASGPATFAGCGALRLAGAPSGWSLSGTVERVPWGREAGTVVLVASDGAADHLVRVDVARARIEPRRTIAGLACDTLVFEDAPLAAESLAKARPGIDGDALLRLGAALRTLLIAGTLDRVLALTIRYAGERVQFGRPLAKFQAIQHAIALLAEQAALGRAAGAIALAALESGFDPVPIAAAKAVAGEAAGVAAGIAHQVHGAIGFTQEHSLHFFTKALWSWRDQDGTDAYWTDRLGAAMAQAGPEGFWPAVTAALPSTAAAEAVRREVRAFLAAEAPSRSPEDWAMSWMAWNRDFSRKMGARGWIGMTWPKRYGGQERSNAERYVVLEEMLAAGAPVNAHWVADRQSGPLLLKLGSEAQRREILPAIAAGECSFCIGMSEPDAGSDLAAVRTRAVPVDGGYRITGTKVWTTIAHRSRYMILFCRTSGTPADRQKGTSQLLVDLAATPGITIRPIVDATGHEHFNEVVFEEAFVPREALIGKEGEGWAQVTGELALERSGPERFLSSMPVVIELLRVAGPKPDQPARIALGRLAARLMMIRYLSRAIADLIETGEDPTVQAAIVKDLGAVFEQEVPEVARLLVPDGHLAADRAFGALLGAVTVGAPSFSLRGGTREILRGIIARDLGLR